MKKVHLLMALACCALLIAGPGVFANVWIDEGFEDNMAFAPQGDGTATITEGVDIAGGNLFGPGSEFNPLYPLSTQLTHTGSITGDVAFVGTHAYELEAGEQIALADQFSATDCGAVHYLQFAVNVPAIPPAGTMASFNWPMVIEDVTNTWTIDFVSDGSKVDIVAGETLRGLGTQTIGALNGGATEWAFITIQAQINDGFTESDDRVPPFGLIEQGVHFYISDTTPAFNLAGAPDFPETKVLGRFSLGWDLQVTAGTLYVDEFYWECGYEDANNGFRTYDDAENLRPVDYAGLPFVAIPAADVSKWNLYK